MIKIVLCSFLIAVFFTACQEEIIDESIVAKTNTQSIAPQDKFEEVEFSLTTVDAKLIEFKSTEKGIDFKDYKNKKAVLIDVFATWCPPCIKELPILTKLKEKYKDEFEIVSVLFEKDKPIEEVMAFIKKHKINYPITIGEENFLLTKELGDIKKVPEMFLFSKEGEFIKKFIGVTGEGDLERYIKIAIEN